MVGLIDPTPSQLINGDLPPDGKLDVFDAIAMLQMIVGAVVVDQRGPP